MYDEFAHPLRCRTDFMGTLLDVTLRDGGAEAGFRWPGDVYSTVPAALSSLGVDMVDLGYLGGITPGHPPAVPDVGGFLTPDDVAAARHPGLRLAATAHPRALEHSLDFAPYVQAGLATLRMEYHPAWLSDIVALAARAREAGLTTTVSIALASRYTIAELCRHSESIQAQASPDVLFIADTCGALLPHQVEELVNRLTDTLDAELGFHAHNPLSLAYANALAAVDAGATHIDCALLGLGPGAGNLATELVLLRHRLPGHPAPTTLPGFLASRNRLGSITGRPPATLVPAACAALNLTPVEEQALRQFADDEHLDVELAALWLVTAHAQLASLRPDDLHAAWQAGHPEH